MSHHGQEKFVSIYHMKHLMQKQAYGVMETLLKNDPDEDKKASIKNESDELWKKFESHCSMETFDSVGLPFPCHAPVVDPLKCKSVSKAKFQEDLDACADDENKFMILHMNLAGLRKNNKDKIKIKMKSLAGQKEYSPDIVCISEYNNSNARVSDDYQIPISHEIPTHANIGGVAIFDAKDKFDESVKLNIPGDYLKTKGCGCKLCSGIIKYESAWARFKKKEKIINVGAFYRHPKEFDIVTWKCFSNKLRRWLDHILKERNSCVYLVGDFNLDITKPHNEGVIYFWKTLEVFKIKLLITEPTHTTIKNDDGVTRTVIDHIYTNDNTDNCSSGVILEFEIFSSRHHPIYCINKVKSTIQRQKLGNAFFYFAESPHLCFQ